MVSGSSFPVRLGRYLLAAVAAVAMLLILARALVGPFGPIHNPIGLECAAAVSALLAVWLASSTSPLPTGAGSPNWLMAVVLLEVGIAYGSILTMPLVTDDYIQLHQISGSSPLGLFAQVGAGSQFYRPITHLTYWAEWKAWGTAALPRHAFDLVLHAASSLLFFLLVRCLAIPRPFDILAALAFTWHGIRPEVVAWTAARADALALFFSLAAALAISRRTSFGFGLAVLAIAAACLSKESAFALPFLLAPFVWLDGTDNRRTAWSRIGFLFAIAGAVFLLRWWMLQGIGGYSDDAGAPRALDISALGLAKTFGSRIWGVLWYPVNWSMPLEWWMKAAFSLGTAGWLLMLKAQPDRRRLALAIACVAAACIPVHHLLLIDSTLEKSRYLTLASVPFVLVLVYIWLGMPRKWGIAAAALIVTFEVAAVDHNLKIWKMVAISRLDACREIAEIARKTEAPLAVTNMPMTVNGVYWRNGFEECLLLNFGIPLGRVRVNGAPPAQGELELPWAGFRKDPAPRR